MERSLYLIHKREIKRDKERERESEPERERDIERFWRLLGDCQARSLSTGLNTHKTKKALCFFGFLGFLGLRFAKAIKNHCVFWFF